LTHLRENAAPIIRYQIGDIVNIKNGGKYECECGVKLSVLNEIRGRENDLIRSPSGDYVHPEVFDYIMRYQTEIERFRIIEETVGKLRILLQVKKPMREVNIDLLVKKLEEHAGKDFEYIIEQTDSIPNEPGGKFRWVISKLHEKGDL
jgi:phenylacetate-CoA ligase